MSRKFSLLTVLAMAAMLMMWVGCSDDDDNPVGPGGGDTALTFMVNATSYDDYTYFSLSAGDTLAGGVPKPLATGWDIAFRRDAVMLNGGTSTTNNGDVEAYDLGAVNYDDVTIGDTVGITWMADGIDNFIDSFYIYNGQTHQLTANNFVWSMVDAEGDNYIKFKVDSMVGAGMPPSMGTVHLTYFYQSTASDPDLSGTTTHGTVVVDAQHGYKGYFDFSTGAQVIPFDPMAGTDWDIAFANYDCMQNSGPNGSGSCAAFPAWGELADPTDIDGFTSQPTMAPMFPDKAESAVSDWYTYNGQTHRLTSNESVYLLKTEGTVYKLQILSYYNSVGGTPVSGYYTFQYNEL